MKKRNLRIFSVLILFSALIILSGCQAIPEDGFKGIGKFGKKTESQFSGRLVGVDLTTIPSSKEIRSGESFGIAGVLKNNLEQPIEGKACLSDKVSDSFGGIPSNYCQSFFMEAADERGPDQIELFQDTSFTYDVPFDFGDVGINSYIIYKAKMQGIVKNVCIKPDLFENPECKNAETFSRESLDFSSGPLVITSVKKEMSKQENQVVMRLFVTLQKLGNSHIISSELVDSVDLEGFIKDNDVVITANYAGIGEFACDNDNIIEIVKSSTEIECVGKFSVDEIIESPVSFVVEYGVRETKNVGIFPLVAREV